MLELDEITGVIVDAAIRVHKELGPGLLESVYEIVLSRSLSRRGLQVERQKAITFEYDGIRFEEGFRVDLLVEGCVVIELKSVEQLAPVHAKQLLTYLRLMNLPVGLLINFGGATLKEGFKELSTVPSLGVSASPREQIQMSHAETLGPSSFAEGEIVCSLALRLPIALNTGLSCTTSRASGRIRFVPS